jgi:UDP-N-acetylmuramoyl-tripeptide--D-alanyl-D-alanine ligase
MNFFKKCNLYLNRPRVIVVIGNNKSSVAEAIYQVLSKKLKAKKISIQNIPFVNKDEILIIESDIKELNLLNFLVKNSSSPILLVTNLGEIPTDSIFFRGDKNSAEDILKFINILPNNSQLVLNFDDETLKEIKNSISLKIFTFGFGEGSDFLASDVKFNHMTNFKLNYQGNIVPIWLDFPAKKAHVYNALAAISLSTILNLNLIEVSQIIKNMKIS